MKQVLRDVAALVARLGVGGIFFANGWTKLEDGLKITGSKFLEQGAPAPQAWATVTMLAELIGGALLIAGLAVSITGLILFAEALSVFLVAPPLNPITMNELILLGAASLLLAVVGAGRVSVDHMVVIRRREAEAADEFAADKDVERVLASFRDPDDPDDPGAAGAPGSSGEPAREPEAATSPEERPARPVADKEEPAPQTPGAEDTAPHPRPRTPAPKRAEDPVPAPGDTLVAGRKKPAPRARRSTSE
ncbi:DoxX family membrane protein [Actinomadura sp. ATCC 31491]|uniref:DoxX family membrane protein n=1 Tax=Actinomadura luzonensis TaxID=2805427 RepID=A0ABT0FZL2_9ACTN|nr:DoxX family protein [Actinomadura luzonensis]MCK2217750.1 DoxX family membrane protein [Actinomadura luzonensis]